VAQPTLDVLIERIWQKCEWQDDCLIFDGALAKGYGRIGYYDSGKQKVQQTHRLVWESVHGPIEDELTIEHGCTTRACQNIEHMELMTRGDNSRAGAGRNPTVIANRAKARCPQGHPYDQENTYRPPSGGRYCRTCGRAATKRWRESLVLTSP
jgi:hypothetical protein